MANEHAGAFDPADPATAALIEELKRRCRRADPGRGEDTAAHIDTLAAQWADAAQRCRDQRERLVYKGGIVTAATDACSTATRRGSRGYGPRSTTCAMSRTPPW